LARNFLKGAIGDRINLLMAACAWNLKPWLLAISWLFFPAKKMDNIHQNFCIEKNVKIKSQFLSVLEFRASSPKEKIAKNQKSNKEA